MSDNVRRAEDREKRRCLLYTMVLLTVAPIVSE